MLADGRNIDEALVLLSASPVNLLAQALSATRTIESLRASGRDKYPGAFLGSLGGNPGRSKTINFAWTDADRDCVT